MSDRNNGLLAGVPRVFGAENHTYCVRHLTENLMTKAGRLGIWRNASKDLIKEIFNRVAYATAAAKYDCALQEMRTFKREQHCGWKKMNLNGGHIRSSRKRGGVS